MADNKTTTVSDSSKPSTTTSAPEGNTVRRSKDEPDALDTTPTSEPLADQPKEKVDAPN